ncbi:MAG TPA: sodium:solute symporter family protein [Tangfeifania sp.]|nr:sodium:solute symporter family protein [Tangfeifania sp.]
MQPVTIIIIYFILILLIGVYSAFKIKSPSDYYVAGKNAGWLPVSGSLLATILGGSAILGTIELSQQTGWPALWFLFCAALGLFVLTPLAKYVRRFGKYTLPELLGHFFGKRAEFISSVIIPVAWLGIVAAQIIAAAKIIAGLDAISYSQAAIISGAVFILYTLIGGQLSILKTDTLQSVLIVFGLSALTFVSLQKNGTGTFETLHFGSLFNATFSMLDLIILMLTYSVTFVVGPDIYSRVFCAKDEKTATRSIFTVALILLPISFLLTYLGIFSGESGEKEILAFAHTLLPGWFYGLFLAALLSAVMSSADTTLLTSSLILSELISGNPDKKNSLKMTRILIVVLGGLSIVLALFVTSILQSLLLALTFFSGAFVVPMLAGLLKLKVVKPQLTAAVLAGGFVALAGKIINVWGDSLVGNLVIIAAFLVNGGLLFVRIGKSDRELK